MLGWLSVAREELSPPGAAALESTAKPSASGKLVHGQQMDLLPHSPWLPVLELSSPAFLLIL